MNVAVFEVVAVTGHRGAAVNGHRWALRQLETGSGHFAHELAGKPLTWPTLRDVDLWLQKDLLPDGAVVVWPAQVLIGVAHE